ncbi:ankyrin repeat-containing domain, PGG domain protein, partial [Tanacetum coccineum]
MFIEALFNIAQTWIKQNFDMVLLRAELFRKLPLVEPKALGLVANAELYKALSEGDDAKVCRICLELPDGPFHMLTIHNESVLHSATTNNKTVGAAAEMLCRAPLLLTMKDKFGETALFRAARYGKT